MLRSQKHLLGINAAQRKSFIDQVEVHLLICVGQIKMLEEFETPVILN